MIFRNSNHIAFLMTESRQMRLSLAAKKLDKGIVTLVEILGKKGHKVENNPNAKLNIELLEILAKHFNNPNLLDSNEPQKTSDEPIKLQDYSALSRIELSSTPKSHIKPNIMESPIQKILFGSPGTGKSFKVEAEYLKKLKIEVKSKNCIKTVFHPEYTYGDFMGKLLPKTIGNTIQYNYYEGDFLKALSQAYVNIIENNGKAIGAKNVILVIDEINRGNSAAIFGTIFQLLDRDSDGYSSYPVKISEMEFAKFIELISPNLGSQTANETREIIEEIHAIYKPAMATEKYKKLEILLNVFKENNYKVKKNEEIEKFVDKQIEGCFLNQEIKLPPNLSVIGTMNTSDNSIYYMDSAFKRRWDWEYIDIKSEHIDEKLKTRTIEVVGKQDYPYPWVKFVDSLNDFLKSQNASIRKIEDKQIGYYFIKEEIVSKEAIRNKLMFFLWDSVFTNNKNPLIKLLKANAKDLITFGDFVKNADIFCNAIIDRNWEENV